MMDQVHLPCPISEPRAIFELLWGSMECNLLLWRPMALNAHPTCANVVLWRIKTPYRETKLKLETICNPA